MYILKEHLSCLNCFQTNGQCQTAGKVQTLMGILAIGISHSLFQSLTVQAFHLTMSPVIAQTCGGVF
jgi:hypothetical protein